MHQCFNNIEIKVKVGHDWWDILKHKLDGIEEFRYL